MNHIRFKGVENDGLGDTKHSLRYGDGLESG